MPGNTIRRPPTPAPSSACLAPFLPNGSAPDRAAANGPEAGRRAARGAGSASVFEDSCGGKGEKARGTAGAVAIVGRAGELAAAAPPGRRRVALRAAIRAEPPTYSAPSVRDRGEVAL
ncbi:hypothetical protein KM043_004947 [Ampulex compressa]|nr:hypothetical protein KM043_004947 [Ampulex compressa]